MRSSRRRLATRVAAAAGALLFLYLIAAYVVAPFSWDRYEKRHPALDDVPGITVTADLIPGDPINVGLIGPEDVLKAAMRAAGWYPADALSIRSDLKIAEATVLGRPYAEAPVSSLYLWGRKEDLAFEQPVGDNPRKRHHVRFWKAEKLDADGRPFWAGSVTFDERVGLSETTGQVTHHISPDVDAERDRLFRELRDVGGITDVREIPDFHEVRSGRNGGGDPWRTDGTLDVAVVRHPNRDRSPTDGAGAPGM